MDFEEELDLFCVRKESNIKTLNGNKFKLSRNTEGKVANSIPMMLKHIQTLNEDSWKENTNIIKIFNGKILFKHCLVYGKIMSKGKETKAAYSYLLDDGTGCLDIKLFRKNTELETVSKLENELEVVQRDMLAQNKNEIVKGLRNLLLKTKQQLDNSNIPVGCKVLVYGKPSYYRGQISVDAYYVTQDGETDRDVEIAFKDKLIEWYSKNILQGG